MNTFVICLPSVSNFEYMFDISLSFVLNNATQQGRAMRLERRQGENIAFKARSRYTDK